MDGAVAEVIKALREGKYVIISTDDVEKQSTVIAVQGSEPRTVDKGFHSLVDKLFDELERIVAERKGVQQR